ncbi:MAG: flagellar hook-associated protein FlgK [Bacteroidetes bacterium]|nr:flagellar hook-associated protein FlgK [Bacteroidota bacterium]
MSNLSMVLETARRALMSHRVAMDTVGHNVANAETPGYTRQRVNFEATPPLRTSVGLLGTGVTVGSIERIREQFIDTQIRSTNDALGKAKSQYTVLSQVEAMVNEPSDTGLSSQLDAFFNAFQDLSVHPEESAYRNAVLQQGDLLAQTFHQFNSNLQQLQNDLENDVNTKIQTINSLSKKISELDLQIIQSSSSGVEPNDLRDQRDYALRELSEIVRINVSEDSQGAVLVAIGGTVIASKSEYVELSAQKDGNTITITSNESGRQLPVQSGSLGGILEIYNTTIPSYIEKINTLASALITNVNNLHRSGYGIGTPAPTGNDFFVGTSATDIGINQDLVDNPNLVAASGNGQTGDNSIAIALSNLQTLPVLNGNSTSIPQFYSAFVSELGTAINTSENLETTQSLILSQLDVQRSSVSGVSIDEEMTNMIKYQRAFDASARMISTVDEMFQTILNMVA